jgi:hypothetical protein
MTEPEDDMPPDAESSEHWSVVQCDCGHITLRIGGTERTFSPEEFAQLHRLLDEALRAFQIAPSLQRVAQRGTTTRH